MLREAAAQQTMIGQRRQQTVTLENIEEDLTGTSQVKSDAKVSIDE